MALARNTPLIDQSRCGARFFHVRPAHLLGAFVVLQFVLGCAPGGVSPRPAAPASLEQLASLIGCQPRVQSENMDFRQGTCRTPETRYTVATFTTDKGAQDWLGEAKPYGGSYLAGTRWIVGSNEPERLEELSDRLGGKLHAGSAHH